MNPDSESESRTARQLSLRHTEIVALASTLLAFAITVAFVDTTPLVEGNALTRTLATQVGWSAAGLFGITSTAAAFAILYSADRRGYRRTALGGGLSLAALSAGDLAINVGRLAQVGWPSSVPETVVGTAAPVVVGALVVAAHPHRGAVVRGVDRLRPAVRRAAPAAIALLMVTSTMGGLALVGTHSFGDGQSGTASASDGETYGLDNQTIEEQNLNMQTATESGETVYSGFWDNTVKAIDAETGEVVWTFDGHSDSVFAVSASPSGDTVYSGSDDNTVKAIDAETGQEKWSFGGHSNTVNSVSASPSGDTVYSGSGDNTVKAIDAETGEVVWTFDGHSDTVKSLSASPNGDTLYSGSGDDTVKAIDAETGQEKWSFGGHSGGVEGVSASPSGDTVYSGSFDDTVKAIDAETGQEKWSFGGHSNTVHSVSASPSGDTVYSGSGDSTVKAIDAETGEVVWTFDGHSNTVESVSASPSGDTVFSGSFDSSAKAIDAETGQEKWTHSDGSATVYAVSAGYPYATGSGTSDLNGTVSDPTGDGHGGATVELINDSDTVVSSVSPSGNGSYTIPSVAKGNYTLRVQSDVYDTVRRSVSVSGDPVTVDVQLGYQQTLSLNDPRGIFKPFDPDVTVYRWDGAQLTTRSPTEGADWSRTQTRGISWDGDVELGLADGEFYALVLEAEHSAEANGSAEATLFGFVGDPQNDTVTWDVSEPVSESNSTLTANRNNETVRLVYDGPSVEDLNYTIRDGNQTLDRNLSFDEPRSYYDGQFRLGNGSGNVTDPESVSYSGTYRNGSTFNGSTQFQASNFSSFGPVSGGGGGGPPISPIWATTGIAAVGVLIYSRSSGKSIGELASGVANAARSVIGRGGR